MCVRERKNWECLGMELKCEIDLGWEFGEQLGIFGRSDRHLPVNY